MKEILIKFESEVDYNRFITEIVNLSIEQGKAEFDQSNDILIIKKQD